MYPSFLLIIIIGILIHSFLSQPIFLQTCPSLSQTTCQNTDGCWWGQCYGTVNFALIPCSSHTDLYTCQNAGCTFWGCLANSGPFSFQASMTWPGDCTNFTNSKSCIYWGCTWDSNSGTCQGDFPQPNQCSDLTASPQQCWLANGCFWTDGYCSGTSTNWTYSSVNPKTCTQIPVEACDPGFGCGILCNGTAGPSCMNFIDVVTCSVYPGCQWNYTQNQCFGNISLSFDCSRFSPDVCTSVPGCKISSVCSNLPCQNISNSDICSNTPGCMWYISSCIHFMDLIQGYGHILTINTLMLLAIVCFLILYDYNV